MSDGTPSVGCLERCPYGEDILAGMRLAVNLFEWAAS